MAIIKFNVADEFIDELGKCCLEAPVVRLTNLFRAEPKLPIKNLFVIATTKASNGDIIRLEKFCGQVWGVEEQDRKTLEKAEQIHDKIQKACEQLKMEVRAGVIE